VSSTGLKKHKKKRSTVFKLVVHGINSDGLQDPRLLKEVGDLTFTTYQN